MTASAAPLSEVARFVRGVTYKPADVLESASKDSLVCMRTANVQVELDESSLVRIRKALVSNTDKLLCEGDILVSTANSWNLVGKCCWVPKLGYEAVPGGFIAALRADKSQVDPRYLYRWFSSSRVQDLARNCGRQTTNISNMDLERCLAIKIPLPPLPEQRRIAAILDKVDALRAKRREAITKLDQLLQSVFLDMFGGSTDPQFQVADLAAHSHAIRTGPFGSQLLHSEFSESGIAVLGIDNVVSNTFTAGQPRFITKEKYALLQRYRVLPGDVLITIMGTCGRCAVVPEDIPLAINTKHLCCISLNQERCNPEYLHSYFLMHPNSLVYLQSRAKGAIMSGLNMGIIKEMPVALPTMDRQQAFVAVKQEIRQQAICMGFQVEKQELLFRSLQHRAFTGTS